MTDKDMTRAETAMHNYTGDRKMNEDMEKLLDDADRIVATDLYPERCRTVIANLATAFRAQCLDLKESREYGVALVQELADRAVKTDAVLALAHSMDADFEAAMNCILRITGPNGDGEYWLHMKNDNRIGGLNLGAEHSPMVKSLLDCFSGRPERKQQ